MKKQTDPDQDPLTLLRTDGKPRKSLTQQPPRKLLFAVFGLAIFIALLLLIYGQLDMAAAQAAIRLDDPESVVR